MFGVSSDAGGSSAANWILAAIQEPQRHVGGVSLWSSVALIVPPAPSSVASIDH